MATEVLNVQKRKSRGKLEARRMRARGETPAILYGHRQENVSLSLKTDELATVLRHGAHLVELRGAVKESAFLRDIQWDAFGSKVLHVDLTRVDRDEEVEVALAVELRGQAPGSSAGGMVEQPMHQMTIRCKASAIPEKITVNINELGLGESITAAQVELPEGVQLLGDPETVVALCVQTVEVPEEEAEPAEATGAEPEVIGRKAEEEEDNS